MEGFTSKNCQLMNLDSFAAPNWHILLEKIIYKPHGCRIWLTKNGIHTLFPVYTKSIVYKTKNIKHDCFYIFRQHCLCLYWRCFLEGFLHTHEAPTSIHSTNQYLQWQLLRPHRDVAECQSGALPKSTLSKI